MENPVHMDIDPLVRLHDPSSSDNWFTQPIIEQHPKSGVVYATSAQHLHNRAYNVSVGCRVIVPVSLLAFAYQLQIGRIPIMFY